MKKFLLVFGLTITLLLCSCGKTDPLDGKSYEWEIIDGFSFTIWTFDDGKVLKTLPMSGETENGTYVIDGYELKITWEDGQDQATYDPESDTLVIADGAVTFTRMNDK